MLAAGTKPYGVLIGCSSLFLSLVSSCFNYVSNKMSPSFFVPGTHKQKLPDAAQGNPSNLH
jgi:hypothetical protein